jgi:hypothetical protein
MKNQDFTTTISVAQTPEEALNAIRNVRGWWSENILKATLTNSAMSSRIDTQDVHHCKTKLVEVIPGKKLVWLVLDNFCNFTEDRASGRAPKSFSKSLKRVIKRKSTSLSRV